MTDGKKQEARPGSLLVAAANMVDPNFGRTVVLLCEHRKEGSFGLVLNQPIELKISELVETCGWDCDVFRGGPVDLNSLHILHCRDDIEIGSHQVIPGVYWGGDFRKLNGLLAEGVMEPHECRFFLGYSGWGEQQLDDELAHDAWYVADASVDLVFRKDNVNHWRETLKRIDRKSVV